MEIPGGSSVCKHFLLVLVLLFLNILSLLSRNYYVVQYPEPCLDVGGQLNKQTNKQKVLASLHPSLIASPSGMLI